MSRKSWEYICVDCTNKITTKSSRKPGIDVCRPCLALRNIKIINDRGLQGSHRLRPFEHIFNTLLREAKSVNREVKITYEQYLEFTKIEKCHYCFQKIMWSPFSKNDSNGRGVYSKYFLDRKDNSIDYELSNVVVCCALCNKLKGYLFSYEEFLAIIPIIVKMRTGTNLKEQI